MTTATSLPTEPVVRPLERGPAAASGPGAMGAPAQAPAAPPPTPGEVEAGVERFFGAVSGYMTFHALAIGRRTGLLSAVLQAPGTVEDVCARAGTSARSTAEWLAAMTAAGFVQHRDGVFAVPAGQAALFAGGVLPFDPTVLLEFDAVMARVMPRLLEAVRDGRGVPYSAYQPEFSASQDALSAPVYDRFLVQDWLASVDGLTERLTAGIDVVDLGCGGGRALCRLAAAFPSSRFVGYDVDGAALEIARDRAGGRALRNVRFEHRDVARLDLDSAVDLALAVDAVHDQARPEQVVREARRALRPDGLLLLVEPTATGDLDTDAAHPMAVIGYMTSLAHCTQISLAEGGPGLGSMWGRRGALALLASVGFEDVRVHESPCDYTVYAAGRGPA